MRTLRSLCHLLAASAAFVSVVAVSSGARAQGVALDRFDPAPAGDRMFGVPSPFAAGSLTPNVSVLADYAHRPLVLRSVDADERVGVIVSSQLFLHLGASVALWNRLNVNVEVPIAVAQDGDAPTVGGQTYPSPKKAQVGDLRFGARVRLSGEVFDPFQIAIGGYVWVPTAPSGAYVGDGRARGLPQVIVGGHTDRFVWSAAAGPEIRAKEQVADAELGSMFKFGAGVGVLLGEERHLQLGVETSWGLGLRDLAKNTANGEALADVRYRIGEYVEIGGGVGPGLTSGAGTPDVRAIAMIAIAPEPKRAAAPVAEPMCADAPTVRVAEGCPETDRDHDGVADRVDACPDVAGVADADPARNGCPAPSDRDHDGIVDSLDACPDVAGVADPDPKKNGCPVVKVADRDGDGVPDAEDACSDVAGQPSPDPKKNGCPQKITVNEKEITVLEQVQFETGRATIKAASDALLDEVAAVFKDHPEILKVEVQGHTDNKGLAAQNKVLSQARAEAVLAALVKRGIGKERLAAKGYGQEVPLVPNDSDDARQKNRRVQFAITERKTR